MTKRIILSIGLFMSLTLGSAVWAADITISGTNSGGGDLVFTPSPSTTMNPATTPSAFTIVSASTKTTQANGIEYALISADGNIYQMKQAADGIATAAGTAGVVPTGFAVKGGSGSEPEPEPAN